MANETRAISEALILESANTKALIQATTRSFEIIVPLSKARSDHGAVQSILQRIHEEGAKYVVSVSNSVETAQSGYSFAKRAQDLCTALADGKGCPNEVINESIIEMRKIAQKAHAAAKATASMFRANRQEFTEIRVCTSETLKSIEMQRTQVVASRDQAVSRASSWKRRTRSLMGKDENGSSSLQIAKAAIYLPAIAVTASGAQIFKKQAKGRGKKAVSYEQALQRLEPAEKDLELLMVEMDVLAQYWLEVDTALEDIYVRVADLRDDKMLQMRIRGLNRDWKEVASDYKTYKTALLRLLDHNPQYGQFVKASRMIAAAPLECI